MGRTHLRATRSRRLSSFPPARCPKLRLSRAIERRRLSSYAQPRFLRHPAHLVHMCQVCRRTTGNRVVNRRADPPRPLL
jgi:hypothetical protein